MEAAKQSAEDHIMVKDKFIFRLGLVDTLRLTMVGTLISLATNIAKLHIHIPLPGHTSIYWMGLLVLGKGLIPKFGAGIIMGFVSGALAVLLAEGKESVFVFFRYFMSGLFLDFLPPVLSFKLESPVVGAICGALAGLVKLMVNIAVALLLKLPLAAVTMGLGIHVFSHVLFGAAGGAIASSLIKRLRPILAPGNKG